jgi:hypothetical protein
MDFKIDTRNVLSATFFVMGAIGAIQRSSGICFPRLHKSFKSS